MKKVLILAGMAILLALQSKAQSGLSDAQKARLQSYRDKLNLTDEQKPKVRAIDSVYFTGLAGLKQSQQGRLAKYKQFKSLSSTRDQQMKAVLTPQQFEQYQQFREEVKEEMKEKRRQQQG